MTIQLIKPFEARLTAGGPGIQGRRGVLYQTVDETPARLYVWDGEKHVPLPVLGPDGSLNNGGEAYALATAETLVVWNDDATALLKPGGAEYLAGIEGAYTYQPATWYAGEINSVVTPTITADGDLTTATDQVPLKWRVVVNADDDVAAAQALLDNGPNVIEVLLGAQAQPVVYADGSATPEVITRIYAVCVSSSAVPADYNGGAYIVSGSETDLADMLANMARFEFSAGLGATVARLVASPVYNTHYAQLSVAAGVVA